MGGFGEIFGFEGRINRLGYLWRSIVMGIGLVIVTAGGVWLLAFVIRPDGVAGVAVAAQQVLTGVLLLALWSSFALASRRLRDMGLEPAHIVPFYAALWVVNTVLVEPISRLDPAHFGLMEALWATLQWVAAVPLLLWPSRSKPPPMAAYYETPQPTAYLNWRESSS